MTCDPGWTSIGGGYCIHLGIATPIFGAVMIILGWFANGLTTSYFAKRKVEQDKEKK